MSPEEQLLAEERNRTRQTAIAVAAGVFLMLGAIISLSGPHAAVNELTLGLITDHRRGARDLIAAIVNGVAQVAIAITLVYLFRCARARAERAPRFVPWLAIVGAALAVVAGILDAVVIMQKVHEFVTTGAQTYDEANHLTSGPGLLVLQIAAQLASLIVAIAFVLVSLQAMRVGLLPKYLGYVGMLAGALVLFPIVVVPVVQLYWLLAVAYLFSGRWPSGLPAAWRTGKAEAWPSSAELRARRAAAAEEARDRRAARKRGETVPDVVETTATVAEPDAAGAPANPRRKRKRKH